MPYLPRSATDITADLDLTPLEALSDEQRALLTVMMARLAERSYRRGFQQGVTIGKNRPSDLPRDLHAWRYGVSTDVSMWADSYMVETAIDRLHTENGALLRLGFSGATMGVVQVDASTAAQALIRLAAEYRRAIGPALEHSNPEAGAIAETIRGFGGELFAAGGPALMSEVYDLATEEGGAQAVQWVSPKWTGIGGWSA